MRLLRRIAVVCGAAGAILTITGAAVLVIFVVPKPMIWWYFAVLGLLALAGVIALCGIALRKQHFGFAKVVMWLAAAVTAITALWVDPFVLGVIFAPAYILLALSAIGLSRTSQPSSRASQPPQE